MRFRKLVQFMIHEFYIPFYVSNHTKIMQNQIINKEVIKEIGRSDLQ